MGIYLPAMRRRKFLGVSALGGAAALASACQPNANRPESFNINTQQRHEWIMVTTWPPGFPILHDACLRLAEDVKKMSGGLFNIKVYGAGELIPAFECFEAVSLGTAAIASGASYYWAGKLPSAQFFASLPFGLNAQGMNTWLSHGGGLEVWRKIYSDFNLLPFPGGNTGVQMAGWFNREIEDMQSLQGLKMRIPGLGGKVFERAGGTTLLSPGNELYTNLERGVIDATEWIGPYHDYLMGFHEVAEYYYSPGWHEPGSVLEMILHKPTFEALPAAFQTIIETAIASINSWTLQAFEAQNGMYIEKIAAYGTKIRSLPTELLTELKVIAQEVISEVANQDEFCRKAYNSYSAFAKTYGQWSARREAAYWQKLHS